MTLPANLPVLSRVTIQNPRPRKFASAAERQKAFRERFPTLTVRVEEAQAEAIRRIADEQGRTQQEVLLSMLKFALTNRNWLQLGLTQHKQLPRFEDVKDNPNAKTRAASEPYDDPELWAAAKDAARKRLGGHSARAMQLAGQLYRAAGGGYRGRKSAAQRSLTTWTKQDWTTKSGKRSRDTGERYLPRKVLEQLTPQEYAATTSAKRKGTAEGKQFVAQPAKIRAKVARLKHKDNPMARTPTPAQLAARERFAEMARSGAFKRKVKRNKNPINYSADGGINITDTFERSVASSRTLAEHYANQLRIRGKNNIVYVVFGITPEAKSQAGRLRNGVTITLNPRDYDIAYAFHPTRGDISKELKAKRNPAKKTVSQKISQLSREGYPQKQAVAIALEQQRRGKVKTNPRKPTYRRTPYVAPDPDLAFTRAYDLLNNLDFEDVYYRERRISAAKGVRLNAALDRILDAMERLAKNMKP